MPTWRFNHLTVEQAWCYVEKGDDILDDLSEAAQLELAGLSAFGESGDQPQFLSYHVDPITEGDYPGTLDPAHVRASLIRLGIREP